jgi:hypothetical protein
MTYLCLFVHNFVDVFAERRVVIGADQSQVAWRQIAFLFVFFLNTAIQIELAGLGTKEITFRF